MSFNPFFSAIVSTSLANRLSALLSKCDRDYSVHRSAIGRKQRAGFRHLRPEGSSVLPDSQNGSYGSQGWDVETPGIGSLRT
ncbi:hypothetical protein CEXT_684771 [Caerostris extrusa]|uniref:Uncharacterized protein n=1 Tax=Caerostris extrusa TaxID=172846 RepID=A0AAV4TNG2_CAEEX|nr:hypothetical protein CEXT_684771 [Caerostris extrusa]